MTLDYPWLDSDRKEHALKEKEYRDAHKDAVDHSYKGKHPVKEDVTDNYKSGYKQGLTQAHNLRIAIKEHELPYWAKHPS
jgi:hypothetical protein